MHYASFLWACKQRHSAIDARNSSLWSVYQNMIINISNFKCRRQSTASVFCFSRIYLRCSSPVDCWETISVHGSAPLCWCFFLCSAAWWRRPTVSAPQLCLVSVEIILGRLYLLQLVTYWTVDIS